MYKQWGGGGVYADWQAESRGFVRIQIYQTPVLNSILIYIAKSVDTEIRLLWWL